MNLKSTTIKVINQDLAWRRKKTNNWKEYQLNFIGATDIEVDHKLKQYITAHPDWTFNLQWANASIQAFAAQAGTKISNTQFDFYIICDLEFGKLPLAQLESTIKQLYQDSLHGGYFSFQSYFLNWNNQAEYCKAELHDDMDIALTQWIEQYLEIDNYTNDSLQISKPLTNVTAQGEVIAGSDFMYTHGNIRIWTWK